MSDSHLYAVRDRLYKLVDDASDVDALLAGCDTIITVLENTEGLWQHARYCYKAKEVAERAWRAVDEYCGTCQHHMTHQKLNRYRLTLSGLAQRYHVLQNMVDPSSVLRETPA